MSELSSYLADKKMENIKHVNKTVKKAKKEKSQIVIPDLGNLGNVQIVGYCDASFMNLNDGGSQVGYVIFLKGDNGSYMPLAWQSKRVRRIVKSTLGAETLAMVDLAETHGFNRTMMIELLHMEDIPKICQLPVKLIT